MNPFPYEGSLSRNLLLNSACALGSSSIPPRFSVQSAIQLLWCVRCEKVRSTIMFKLNLLLFTLCTCLAREPPIVSIPDQGTIMGKEVSMIRTQRIIAYLGIPYAQPPIGNLRFAPPKYDELPSWEGTRNATEYAPGCLQTEEDFRPQDIPFLNLISPERKLDVNESCLFLNVFVPYGMFNVLKFFTNAFIRQLLVLYFNKHWNCK